jgi:hypothetical protein
MAIRGVETVGVTAGTVLIVAAPKSVQIPSEIWLVTAGLVAILVLGVALIAWVSRWHRRQGQEIVTAHDQLVAFRLLYERGELSHDEYQRIRAQLLPRLKEQSARPMGDPTAGKPPLAEASPSLPTSSPPAPLDPAADSTDPPLN